MISIVQQTRELIENAQLESLDPLLKAFFKKHGTEEALVPHIAFKKLLPDLPANKDEIFNQQIKILVQEKTELFITAFEKCKKHYKKMEHH